MPGDIPGMGGAGTPADPDYGDSVSVAGTMGSKSDFDRRKKKRYIDIIDKNLYFKYLLNTNVIILI